MEKLREGVQEEGGRGSNAPSSLSEGLQGRGAAWIEVNPSFITAQLPHPHVTPHSGSEAPSPLGIPLEGPSPIRPLLSPCLLTL